MIPTTIKHQANTSTSREKHQLPETTGDDCTCNKSSIERLMSEASTFDKMRESLHDTKDIYSRPEKPVLELNDIVDELFQDSQPFYSSTSPSLFPDNLPGWKPEKPALEFYDTVDDVYQDSQPFFSPTLPSLFPIHGTFPTVPVPELELTDPGLTDEHNVLNSDAVPFNDIEYQDIDGELFVNRPSLADVVQGSVGDCYFVAALASIALHNPGFIENMITDNGNGTYTVSFGGELGDVVVDDDFAVTSSGNPVYAKVGDSSSPELWVAVIEKAFAQAHGSYEAIELGSTVDALGIITGQTDFTNAPPSQFEPEDLSSALSNGQSVTASSLSSNNGKKDQTDFGIVTSHAYVVKDVQQNENGEWIVTVYNPWGTDGREGAIITDSKDEPIAGANDGLITMTYEEFTNNFRSVGVSDDPIGVS